MGFSRVDDLEIEERLARIVAQLSRGGVGDEDGRFALQIVARFLGAKLRARRLWWAPVRYLGCVGEDSFAVDGDAFEELANEAFAVVLHSRRSLLQRATERPGHLAALIRTIVHNFVHDRQRRCDPIGNQVYLSVRAELAALELRGAVSIWHQRDGRPSNASLIQVHAGLENVVSELADTLRTLARSGGPVISFADVIGRTKAAARRWIGDTGSALSLEEGLRDGGVDPAAVAQERDLFRLRKLRGQLACGRDGDLMSRLIDAIGQAARDGVKFAQKTWARKVGVPTATVFDMMTRVRKTAACSR